jgi:hypothetical protein
VVRVQLILPERIGEDVCHQFFVEFGCHSGATVKLENVTFASRVKDPRVVNQRKVLVNILIVRVSHLCLNLVPLVIVQLQVAVLVHNVIVEFLTFDRIITAKIGRMENSQDVDGLSEEFIPFVVFVFFLGAKSHDILELLYALCELLFRQLNDEPFKVCTTLDLREVVRGPLRQIIHALDNGKQDLNRPLFIETEQLRVHQVDQQSSESHR